MVAVWVYGSEPATTAIKNLDDRLVALFMTVRVKQLTWDEWVMAMVDAEAGLEELIRTIRREIALPEFPVRIRWQVELPDSQLGPSQQANDTTASRLASDGGIPEGPLGKAIFRVSLLGS